MAGINEAGAAMFAGALAATYHAHIYGGFQAMYPAQVPMATALAGPSVFTAPPLPVEEPPPPPPGVDDPPLPANPPPPPPPPDDSHPPSPNDDQPPLPPGTEPADQAVEPGADAVSEKKTDGPVVIQAAAAIIKRPAAVEPPSEPAVAEPKISSEDPLQMRMRATLLAKGMTEADINDYFVQKALKEQLQADSQPSSPKSELKPKKKKKEKEKTKGLVAKRQKQQSSLVQQWQGIRQKELEEENADSEEDDPVKSQQRKIQEWKASQMAGGAAQNNPNFEEVRGDWQERVKRTKRA